MCLPCALGLGAPNKCFSSLAIFGRPKYIVDCMRKGEDGSPDDTLIMRVQSNLRQRNIVVTDYSRWECWGLEAMLAAFKSELEWESSMLEE